MKQKEFLDLMLKQQQEWYQFTPVLFEILKSLKNREFALLNSKLEGKHIATRFLYASSLKYLQMHLKELGVTRGDKLINLYRSNAKFKPNSIPVSSYNLKKRTQDEKYIEFNKNFNNYIEGFDLIIDLDAKTINKSYKIAKEIKKLFDNYKIPYYVQFSGRRGFHLVIPAEYLPNNNIEKLQKDIQKVFNSLINSFGWKDELDVSTLNLKGLIKIPYSFDSGNIALPLDNKQFENFNEDMVKYDSVMKNVRIIKRGLLIRNHSLPIEKLKKNVLKFLGNN